MSKVIRQQVLGKGCRLQIIHGDITQENVDAIVNAANSNLLHGAGVAGAILKKGGREIQKESVEWISEHGPVTHANPAYTGAGNLPCRYVIHAVGPVWGEGGEDKKLADAVTGSLELADQLHISSLSIPAISTGIFGFPKYRGAKIILSNINGYLSDSNPQSNLDKVRIVIIDQPTMDVFVNVFDAFKF